MSMQGFNSAPQRSGTYAGGHWIKRAVKHKGAERAAAKRAGMSTKAYEEKHRRDKGKGGERARLGLILGAMNHNQ